MTNINPGDSPEITLDRLTDMPEGSYVLIDIRDAISFEYGTLQGAVSEPDIMDAVFSDRLPRDRKIVLFCMHGSTTATGPISGNRLPARRTGPWKSSGAFGPATIGRSF